jgi:hypothetical protein
VGMSLPYKNATQRESNCETTPMSDSLPSSALVSPLPARILTSTAVATLS